MKALEPTPPPAHLSTGAAAYLTDPDRLDYPDTWTDAWTVQDFRDLTEPLWCGVNEAIDFAYEATDDVIAGVPVQRVTVGDPTPGAAVLHLHGGMYCLGSPVIDLALTAPLARAADIEIVSVDYRLAPEHPFPAALDDALAVHRALTATGAASAPPSAPPKVISEMAKARRCRNQVATTY